MSGDGSADQAADEPPQSVSLASLVSLSGEEELQHLLLGDGDHVELRHSSFLAPSFYPPDRGEKREADILHQPSIPGVYLQ